MTQQAMPTENTQQLYSVTLRWPQSDQGDYSQYVLAGDHYEACLLTARKMAEVQEEDSDDHFDAFEDNAERETWIKERAADSMECSLVADSLRSDLSELFAAELFPDGVRHGIDIEALRSLVLENRELLCTKPSTPKVSLTFSLVDSGNCRVYYKDPLKRLFCFQLDRPKQFKLLYCTRDGEPSHTVEHLNKDLLDLPPAEPGIAVDFIRWWELMMNQEPTAS
ncbi:hypothetical protein [Pseudomonas sp. PS02290]|uniref:hypothetical protein n=1 Tax=Pseudomonas sp. PS02290 TaxID=2991430 RepID=UPI00249AC43E|nr:hypothetical protein [Pseudomonas sp. PS02290]